MSDEKDRLGDKLRQKEKAEENRFFQEREKTLIEKLKREKEAAEKQAARERAHLRCPKDGTPLTVIERHGVTVEQCPTCRGTWLDEHELEIIAQREHDSWLGRFFFGLRR